MTSWFFYALLASLFMSAFQVSSRLLLRGKGDSNAFTFINSLCAALVLLPILRLEKLRFLIDFRVFFILVLIGFGNGVIDLVFSRARQLEEVSKTMIAIQTGHFWFLFGSFLVFGERLEPKKILAVLLILLSNILIVWRGEALALSKGFLLSLLGTFLFTVVTFVDKKLVETFSPVAYRLVLFLSEAVFIYLILGLAAHRRVAAELKIQGWSVLLVGPFLALAVTFLNKAFAVGGEASRVFPVFSLALVFTTLSGILFLGERESFLKKIFAMTLAFVGAYLVQSA